MKVNVQGGEAIFRNENGDTIIVPRNRRNEAMKYLLKDDHHSLDKLALDLPKAEHYASGGTVIPEDPIEGMMGPETTITAKRPEKSIGNFLNRWGYEHSKDPATSFLGAVGSGLASLVQLSQAAATYMLDPKGNVKPGKALTENGFNKTSVMKSIGKYAVTHNMPNDLSGMLAKAVSTEEGQNVLLDPLLAVNEVAKGISRGSELINGLKKSELINDLGNKYLPNAYKLNPKAFKTSPNKFYRQIDDITYKEGLESGLIRGKQDIDISRGDNIINLNKAFGDDAYYNKGSLYYKDNKNLPYLFEANLPEEKFIPKVNGRTRKYTTDNTSVRVSKNPLPIDDPNITTYKKDWLKGYKKIDLPENNFKSEINWGKWNEEIPNNPKLIEEYNAIEQQSKADGTWMKNPDGSTFNGTPEQFVQQNSENFKKAFPEGSENVFRGTGENIAELRPNRSTFTANQELASGYAPFNKKSNFLNSESVEGGVHSFYRKNSKNSLELDANNTSWTSVDLSNKRLTKDYFERNIKSQEDQIIKQKEYLSKMKQKPNGSWEAPDGTTYSNDLYKNTVGERELYLKDLKERYKNIDNLISNSKELEEMKKVLGNTTTTDDIAAYVEKRNLDYVKLKNIEDSGVGDVTIVNHKPGNYLKSAVGNNGMFDMNNPNIFKGLSPTIIAGALANKKTKK